MFFLWKRGSAWGSSAVCRTTASEVGATTEAVHSFIDSSGHQFAGKHHEIYLTDIRRAVRTIP
jgi:hypothetical protein